MEVLPLTKDMKIKLLLETRKRDILHAKMTKKLQDLHLLVSKNSRLLFPSQKMRLQAYSLIQRAYE